jgi:hypothetical protein
MKPHEECKDTYKGAVCNCEHGYKRKYGDCAGKKITDTSFNCGPVLNYLTTSTSTRKQR